MAPTKKRGAPASASKTVRRKKPSTPEREAKLKAWHDKQDALKQSAQSLIVDLTPAIIPDLRKPRAWTKEMEAVFLQLITLGMPVHEIAKRKDMPSEYVLWTQIADKTHNVSDLYAQGKQLRVAKLEEEIETVSRSASPGKIVIHTHKVVDNMLVPVIEIREFDSIEHRKLLIDTLKWTLAHTRPKKHGRQPDDDKPKTSDQLTALFDAMMKGPVKRGADEDEEDE